MTHTENAEQPKADGVSPTDVAYRMADREARRLSAAPQPDRLPGTLAAFSVHGGQADHTVTEVRITIGELRRLHGTQPEQPNGLGFPPGQLHNEVVNFISEHPEDITHQRLVAQGWTPPNTQPEHCPRCKFTMSGIGYCVDCAQPEQPARDGVVLERWGMPDHPRDDTLLIRRDDGYWTPWHIADEALRCAKTQPPQQADGGAVGEVYELPTGERRVQLSKEFRDLPVGTKLYAAQPPKSPGVTDEMVERLAQFVYKKESINCKTLDESILHLSNWRRAIPEAREMLLAALGGDN